MKFSALEGTTWPHRTHEKLRTTIDIHEGNGLGRPEGNFFYDQVYEVARLAEFDYALNSVL